MAQTLTPPVERFRTAKRLASLDAFRGLTIAAMILVNNPGSDNVYWPLEHADWHGWTPADLIFPFFLFIVGVSVVFSFAHRREQGDGGRLPGHVVYRSAAIFAIGVVLNGFPFFHLSTLRIPGVLQRIALCYLFGSLILLWVGRRARIVVIAALLVGYWALMRFVPVPGFGAGQLEPDGNLAAFIDRAVFGHHLWTATGDPEGLLSTLPAIATLLFGSFAAEWLQGHRDAKRKVLGLATTGAVLAAAGYALSPAFPINKNLWTSTFAIFTAGWAAVLLAAFYWVIDVRGWRAWARPFVVFGVNPILAYAASSLLTKTLVYSRLAVNGHPTSAYRYVFQTLFSPLGAPENASLMFSFSYVVLWLGIMWILYAKNVFVKI